MWKSSSAPLVVGEEEHDVRVAVFVLGDKRQRAADHRRRGCD